MSITLPSSYVKLLKLYILDKKEEITAYHTKSACSMGFVCFNSEWVISVHSDLRNNANNLNSFFWRNVGVERSNVKCGQNHIVWNFRVFNKINEVVSVFYIGLLFIAIGCSNESTKLKIRSVGPLL